VTKTLRQTLLFSGVLLSTVTGWSHASLAQHAAPGAEIVIDSSVLESLSQRQQREMALPSTRNLLIPPDQQLAPVTLRPPQDTTLQAAPTPARQAIAPAQMMTAPVDWKSIEATVLSPEPEKPAARPVKKTAAIIDIPVPQRKPTPPQSTIAAVADPVILQESEPEIKEIASVDVIQEPTIIAAAPLVIEDPVVEPPALLPPVAEPISIASEDHLEKDKTLFQKILSFPIKSSVKSKGGLDPAMDDSTLGTIVQATVPNIHIPEEIVDDVSYDLATPMPDEGDDELLIAALSDDDQSWQQENPQVLIQDVPRPPERPDKQTAPKAFVQEARRAMVDTYTSTEMRDVSRDPMVAHAKARRLSVADLEGDPLANQLKDISVDDVANILNNIAPASGYHLQRELSTVSKPRIVRVQGEWNRKSKIEEPVADVTPVAAATHAAPVATAAPEPKPEPATINLASLPDKKQTAPKKESPAQKADKVKADKDKVTLPFKPGQVDMDDSVSAYLKPDIVESLKSSTNSRIQILAYSSAPDGKESQARRISLSRALAVRSYLVAKGIDAARMDVKALGLHPDPKAAPDQVEMSVIR